jgi:hypothetical protein
MELTPKEKAQIKANFDKCDAALLDKPILASIYDANWRKELREKALSTQKHGEVIYGAMGYAVPIFEEIMECPKSYQYRLEEGASVLLHKISKGEREHIVKRMQSLIPISAEQELLLACGFRNKFDADAIKAPQSPVNKPRPEFEVHINSKQIDIEATVLMDSNEVRQLDCITRQLGEDFWISCTEVDYVERVKNKIKEKLVKSARDTGLIVVLNQYSKFLHPIDVINLIRRIALDPQILHICNWQYPLAISYVCQYYIQGVWFNLSVAQKMGISEQSKEQIRTAVKNSFWPRLDGIFLHEGMSDCEHNKAVDMIRSRVR